MKGIILKNFIPYLYCFSDSYGESINNLESYNENFGYKDQRSQKFEIHRSFLVLPTNQLDMKYFRKKVPDLAKDISDHLCKLT